MVYLDYAANTPVDKEVLDLFYDVTLKYYANPNSFHRLGKEAQRVIEECTCRIAKNLEVLPEEIIYTSGAAEANNLVVKGICKRYEKYGRHIIISSLEHSSVIAPASIMQEAGFEVDFLPVTQEGIVDLGKLRRMLRPDTILVSVCAVDSEIGLVQPISEIGKILREYPYTFFHTDASQAIGKIEMDFRDVDLVTISPHKFYGINGVGVLIKKKNVSLVPIIHGGKSTTVFRSGTPVLGNIVATDKALEIALRKREERYCYVEGLKRRIIEALSGYDCVHINGTKNVVPFTINFSVKGVKAMEFAKMLEAREVYVSTKTSCSSLDTPSKLVYALTRDEDLAISSIRVSLSHLTTKVCVDVFLEALEECIEELKKRGTI